MGYCVLLTDARGVTVDFIGDLQLDPACAAPACTSARLERTPRRHLRRRHRHRHRPGADRAPGRPLRRDAHPADLHRRAGVRPAGPAERDPRHLGADLAAGQEQPAPRAAAGQGVRAARRERELPALVPPRLGAEAAPVARVRRDQPGLPGRARCGRPHRRPQPRARRCCCEAEHGTHGARADRSSSCSTPRFDELGRFVRAMPGDQRAVTLARSARVLFLHAVPPPSRWDATAPSADAAGARCRRRWRRCPAATRARPPDRARGAAGRHARQRADHRRDRQRQGSLRQGAARGQRAARPALRRGQLRGDPRDADRERAVRPPAGQLHRRGAARASAA